MHYVYVILYCVIRTLGYNKICCIIFYFIISYYKSYYLPYTSRQEPHPAWPVAGGRRAAPLQRAAALSYGIV